MFFLQTFIKGAIKKYELTLKNLYLFIVSVLDGITNPTNI